jgi:hypothetical protein
VRRRRSYVPIAHDDAARARNTTHFLQRIDALPRDTSAHPRVARHVGSWFQTVMLPADVLGVATLASIATARAAAAGDEDAYVSALDDLRAEMEHARERFDRSARAAHGEGGAS